MSGSTPIAGPGGMLFAGGGGAGGEAAPSPLTVPGGVKAAGGGKNSIQQNLSSPHSGIKSTITKGDTMSRAMGQYGKGHSFGASPLHNIRGGTGQMKRIRGGLGPGKVGQPGGSTDYSMTDADPE